MKYIFILLGLAIAVLGICGVITSPWYKYPFVERKIINNDKYTVRRISPGGEIMFVSVVDNTESTIIEKYEGGYRVYITHTFVVDDDILPTTTGGTTFEENKPLLFKEAEKLFK